MKLRLRVVGFLTMAAGLVLTAQSHREPSKSELHKQAVAESLIPIRPGIPGKTPFWNDYARRFIFAPAFDFKKTPGAAYYRFTAQARDGAHTFEAEVPWAPLTPIWAELPVGKVTLKVQGLNKKGGSVVGPSGDKTFYRSTVFNGPYLKPVVSYRESARLALRALFAKPEIQSWVRDGKPYRSVQSELLSREGHGRDSPGHDTYTRNSATDHGHAAKALLAARRAADFLSV